MIVCADIHPGHGLIDFERLDEACADAEAGMEGARRTCHYEIPELCVRATRWQWVIHGSTNNYRAGITRWMMGRGQYTRAKRYACCGRGDVGYHEEHGSGVKVKPVCCGYRVCPRCSRRYGRRMLRKIGKHLAAGPHGAMHHIVLTQQVIEGESLAATRTRFEAKWKKVYRDFRRIGLRSMLVTYHVKRTRGVGWHYHAHCLVEWKAEADAEACAMAVGECWRRVVESAKEPSHPVFYRYLTRAGDAIRELATDGQGEFWTESKDAVTQCLQYVVRDVVQGLENWVEGVETEELTEEFAKAVDGAKLHRLFGEWRKAVSEDEEEEEPKDQVGATEAEKKEAAKKGTGEQWIRLGAVDSVIRQATTGVALMAEFLRSLVCVYSNKSDICRRLQGVLRAIGV